MRDPCCDDIIGGEVFLTARYSTAGSGGGFGRFEGMGELNLQPTGVERTSGASSAGSVWVTETPRPRRGMLSFVNRCSHDPMKLFKARCRVDVTFVEKSRGFEHLFTSALVVGLPQINLTTGEITGMEIVGDTYFRNPYSGSAPNPGSVGGDDAPSWLNFPEMATA